MAVTYQIRPEWNFVRVKLRGNVTAQEHVQAFVSYTQEPDFDARQHVLMDLDGFDFPNIFFQDLVALSKDLHDYYTIRDVSSRTSIYAPGDAAYGMSRMYQTLSDGMVPQKTGVFRSVQDAMRFIDLRETDPAWDWVLSVTGAP